MASPQEFLQQLSVCLAQCPADEVLRRTKDLAREKGFLNRVIITGGGDGKAFDTRHIVISLGREAGKVAILFGGYSIAATVTQEADQ